MVTRITTVCSQPRVILLSILFLLWGMAVGCSSVWSGSSFFHPEAAPSAEETKADGDRLQHAFTYFLMASMSEQNEEYEEAKAYLQKALEYDPGSSFLHSKMAGVLKALKDSDGALKYAKKAVEIDPSIENRMLLADLYASLKEEEAAIKEYRKILDIDPNQKRIRLILANAYVRTKQYLLAQEQLDRLIEMDPNLVIAHYYRGRINLELGKNEEAENAYRQALTLSNAMEPALFDLGTLYQMKGEYGNAAKVYEELLGYYPANMMVRERLVHIYYKLGRDKDAESQMEQIKKMSQPGDPSRQTLGLIYLRQGKLDESIAELEMIVTAWPEDDKSRYYLATAYEEKGDRKKAFEHFNAIQAGTEYYSNSRIHIAYILEEEEKHDQAIEVLEKAIELDQKKVDLYLMLASVFENKKAYEKALAVLDQGLKKDQKNVELIFRQGVVLDKMGEKTRSLDRMSTIIEINPNHADALNYIGYTYAEQGIRLDEAMSLIEKALRIKPDSGYIIDSLGWVYFQKGMYDEALRYLEQAAAHVPNDPTIMEHLGDVYFKKGMFKKSLEMYEKALSLNHPQGEKLKDKMEELKKRMN